MKETTNDQLFRDKSIFLAFMIFFSHVKDYASWLLYLIKKFSKTSPSLNFITIFTKGLSLPAYFLKFTNLFLNKENADGSKLVKSIATGIETTLSVVKTIGKLVSMTSKTISILSFVIGVGKLIPSVVDLVKLTYQRHKKVKEEKKALLELEKEGQRLHQQLLLSNKMGIAFPYSERRKVLEDEYVELQQSAKQSKERFTNELKYTVHKTVVATLLVVAGILVFIPAANFIGLFMITVLASHLSLFGTFNRLTTSFDDQPEKNIASVKSEKSLDSTQPLVNSLKTQASSQLNQRVASPKKHSMPFLPLLGISLCISIGLALLTGPIGGIICGVLLGFLMIPMLYNSSQHVKKSLALPAVENPVVPPQDAPLEKKINPLNEPEIKLLDQQTPKKNELLEQPIKPIAALKKTQAHPLKVYSLFPQPSAWMNDNKQAPAVMGMKKRQMK